MSGTFAPAVTPTSIEIFSEYGATLVSRAHSGKTQRRRRGGHTWRLSLRWDVLERADYADLLGSLIDQDGQYETFSYVLPSGLVAARGSWVGTPLVKGASQTDTPVTVDGFTISASNVVRAFDLFKFAGHSKVYAATADKSADGSGEVALAFKPHLIATPGDNEAITHASVPFTVAIATDVLSLPVRGAGLASLAVDLIEVW